MADAFIEKILTDAGLIKNQTFKKIRFLKVPSVDFAVWSDREEADGSDFENLIKKHSATIEVYTFYPDENPVKSVLAQLDKLGIKYTASEKIWIEDDEFFVTYIDFDWVEKV